MVSPQALGLTGAASWQGLAVERPGEVSTGHRRLQWPQGFISGRSRPWRPPVSLIGHLCLHLSAGRPPSALTAWRLTSESVSSSRAATASRTASGSAGRPPSTPTAARLTSESVLEPCCYGFKDRVGQRRPASKHIGYCLSNIRVCI